MSPRPTRFGRYILFHSASPFRCKPHFLCRFGCNSVACQGVAGFCGGHIFWADLWYLLFFLETRQGTVSTGLMLGPAIIRKILPQFFWSTFVVQGFALPGTRSLWCYFSFSFRRNYLLLLILSSMVRWSYVFALLLGWDLPCLYPRTKFQTLYLFPQVSTLFLSCTHTTWWRWTPLIIPHRGILRWKRGSYSLVEGRYEKFWLP